MARARGAAAWGCGGRGSYAVVARTIAPACVLLASLALASTASAQTGGATPESAPRTAPAPRKAPSLPPVRSKIVLSRLACVTGCGADGAVRPGALLRV